MTIANLTNPMTTSTTTITITITTSTTTITITIIIARLYQQRTTEAYIRYIDTLALNCPTMCDWQRELSSTRDLRLHLDHQGQDDPVLIASTWLDAVQGGEEREEESSLDSLFALRDFMLQEALSVVKFA